MQCHKSMAMFNIKRKSIRLFHVVCSDVTFDVPSLIFFSTNITSINEFSMSVLSRSLLHHLVDRCRTT